MVNRCIMIFPNFKNIDIIDKIRYQYDPLSRFFRPHITLVFPFKSNISTSDLSDHIKNVLHDFSPFNLTMQGFSASVEPGSNYLFLNVTEGLQNLYQLSRKLYTGILENYQSDIYKERYCPHLTVGNLDKNTDYQVILEKLQNETSEFATCVNCVSVEIIDNDVSELEMTIPFNYSIHRSGQSLTKW